MLNYLTLTLPYLTLPYLTLYLTLLFHDYHRKIHPPQPLLDLFISFPSLPLQPIYFTFFLCETLVIISLIYVLRHSSSPLSHSLAVLSTSPNGRKPVMQHMERAIHAILLAERPRDDLHTAIYLEMIVSPPASSLPRSLILLTFLLCLVTQQVHLPGTGIQEMTLTAVGLKLCIKPASFTIWIMDLWITLKESVSRVIHA